jgi:hypothetical protein
MVMQTRILLHLSKYNISSKEQYGLRTGLRTNDAMYEVTIVILNSVNNKLAVEGIFCDLEKVFDCVDHEILQTELKRYGIKGKNLALYQSYLDNGYSRTVIHNDSDNKASDWTKISYGTPQGRVLEPLLFLIYTNDLPKLIYKTSHPSLLRMILIILLLNNISAT